MKTITVKKLYLFKQKFNLILNISINQNMKSAQALYQQAYQFQEQKNYAKAYEIMVKIEKQITKNDDDYNQYYNDIGSICFNLKKYNEAVRYFDKCDPDKPISEELQDQAIQTWLCSLVYDGQIEQCLMQSQKFIDQGRYTELAYFMRGYCFQEQGSYAAAVQEYLKYLRNDENDEDDEDNNGEDYEEYEEYGQGDQSQQCTNIAYCYSQLKMYKEARKYIDRAIRNGEDNLLLLLTKSDVYCYFKKPKVAAEALHKAFINYKTNNIEDVTYSPQEWKFIHNKLGGKENEQNIKQLYEYISRNKIEGKQLQVAQQFMSELTDKKLTSISKEVQDQLRALFPQSLLNNLKAEKDLEPLMKDKAISDYYHAFLLEADGSYLQALALSKGFQQSSDDTLAKLGFSVIKMIPFIGDTASSVLSKIHSKIQELNIEARVNAFLNVAKNNDHFKSNIKRYQQYQFRCLDKALLNNQKQYQIRNPKTVQGFDAYMATLSSMFDQVKSYATTEKTYKLPDSAQKQLGMKDAQELIATYYSSGQLEQIQNQDKQDQTCIQFILAADSVRNQINQTKSPEVRDSSCCMIQ